MNEWCSAHCCQLPYSVVSPNVVFKRAKWTVGMKRWRRSLTTQNIEHFHGSSLVSSFRINKCFFCSSTSSFSCVEVKREFEKFRKCRKASWWSAEEVESPERVFLPQHTANVIVLWVLGLYIFASFSWHSNTRNFRVFFFWSRVHHQFQLLFVFVFCSTNDISLHAAVVWMLHAFP